MVGLEDPSGPTCDPVDELSALMYDVLQASLGSTLRRAPSKAGVGKSRACGALASRVGLRGMLSEVAWFLR